LACLSGVKLQQQLEIDVINTILATGHDSCAIILVATAALSYNFLCDLADMMWLPEQNHELPQETKNEIISKYDI